MENKIKFNRSLSKEEIVFWNTLLENLPTNQNAYIYGRYGAWNHFMKDDSDQNKLREIHLELAKGCSSTEELTAILKKEPDTVPFFKPLEKAMLIYKELLPNLTPYQLMHLTIFAAPIVDVNIKVNKNGIEFTSKDKNQEVITYAPQTAFLLELMAGRMAEINNSYNFSPIKASGTIKIQEDKNEIHTISVTEGKKDANSMEDKDTFLVSKEKNYLMQFCIDFSGTNADYNADILSPYDRNQAKLNKDLLTYNLDQKLSKEPRASKKRHKI